MAFQNRRSWRLKFIDIDGSFTMIPAESPLNGYIVARAPKGNARPSYFPQGNSGAIDALVGVASANWPDLFEARSYNDEYPLYISSPAGSGEEYPSFLGGFYFTKNGIYKFHNIKDRTELDDGTGNAYKVSVRPGRENSFNPDFSGDRLTRIIIQSPEFPEEFQLQPEDPGYGVFEFRRDENPGITLSWDRRLAVTEIDYLRVTQGLISGDIVKTFRGDNSGIWTWDRDTAFLANFGFSYKGIEERNPLRDFLGRAAYETLVAINETPNEDGGGYEYNPDMEALIRLFVNGWVETRDDGSFALGSGLGVQELMEFLVSLREDVYCYFMQKSPTEIPTNIRISSIGYDKYRYDRVFAYAPYDVSYFNAEGKLIVRNPGVAAEIINNRLREHEFIAFYDPARPERGVAFIGEFHEDDNGNIYFTDATSMFITQYFTCQAAITGELNENLFHRIFFVENATSIVHLKTEEEHIAIFGEDEGRRAYVRGLANGTSAPLDIWFNTINISNSEEVYPGRITSGGEFRGSLYELGKDSFGNIIYFPEILQDDDMAFIEVRVLKKFGDDLDDLDATGFWKHRRVLDPFDMDRDGNSLTERNFTIEGSRYASFVMALNLAMQRTGGVWTPRWAPIIREGLVEALNGDYDDAYIFMEPTGQEMFKTDLFNISRDHQFAAVISPKILQPNSRGVITEQIARRAIVNGRISERSNAQYAGEFEVRCPITMKRYWRQPIGDIGCNLVRIIERRYGGWSPSWFNVAGDVGGQLKGVVLRARYSYDDEATRILDEKGINPISLTSDEGLMILSQRTTQNPSFVSDWSFLGHSLSFQLVKREVRDNVMRPQIEKPINNHWMGIRQTQVENILARRTAGSSPIWAYASCDIFGQNTEMTKAQRNFIIKMDVRVHTFARTVTLVLENLSSG